MQNQFSKKGWSQQSDSALKECDISRDIEYLANRLQEVMCEESKAKHMQRRLNSLPSDTIYDENTFQRPEYYENGLG